MTSTARWTILALGLLASCSVSTFTEDTGNACSQDPECGASAYCKRPLTECPGLGGVVAAAGACHRSCWNGACTCLTDDDCPGSSCAQGSCLGVGVDCAIVSCSAECPQATLAEDDCPVCLCASCPPADAGSAGVPCGGDGGTCQVDQLCFAVTDCGGVFNPDAGGVGGCYPVAYSCQSAGSCAQTETCDCFRAANDDPCEGSQACDVDGGSVSCQFDRP